MAQLHKNARNACELFEIISLQLTLQD